MGAVKKLIDKKVLRDLVPINALSAVHIQEISKKAIIEDVRSGTYVFKTGERDYQTVYLLEGRLELIDADRNVVETVTAGSEVARHPLAHKQPRLLSARADGKVTIARLDSSLLDVLLTWDESAGYDVVEIDANEDDDWMTRMLQSQAFLQLPPSNIHQLLMRLEAVSASAGDVIVRQGDDGDYFFIVKSGRLAVTRKASARSKEVLLAELGEGACFGEEALVSGTKRNASVMMITDGALMRLSKQDFNELLCAPLVHEADFEGAQKMVAKGARWLDVRLPGEFENQAIKGSINLPLSALRDQCNALDPGTDYIVCCDTGRRSAAGAFVLSQRGFSVYTLKNGLMDVPDDELTRVSGKPAEAAVKAKDAEIIPFEADARPENDDAPGDSPETAKSSDTDTLLIDKLAAAEAEKLALAEQLQGLKAKLDQSEAQVQAIVRQQQDAASESERVKAESGALRGELQASEQALQQKVALAEQEKNALQAELDALKTDVQFSLRKYESVDNEKKALQEELNRLQQTLAQIQQSADGRDGALRGELEQMAGRLETERQAHDKRLHEMEAELTRVRDDYHQLGQRTSAVAGERDAAARDLEAARQQLQALGEQLESSQASLQEATERLAGAGEQATADRSQADQLQAQLATSEQQREAQENEHAQVLDELRKQLEQARNEATAGSDELNGRVAALQQELEEQRRLVEEQRSERETLAVQLADNQRQAETAGKKASEQIEALKVAHATEAVELERQVKASADRLQELEQQLSQQQVAGEQAGTEMQQQLDTLQEQLKTSSEQNQALEEQLQSRRTEVEQAGAGLKQQLEEAELKAGEMEAELVTQREQREQAEKRAAELDGRLAQLNKEHENDVASTREALSRAQMETDNVKRAEARLVEKVRKLEGDLERIRHDHDSEVHRLHRELKEAAGGSGEGLAAELEALKQRLQEHARERDDLEIKLGERSAQFESIQAEAEHLAVQLDQARDSARQAEQQLLESSQAANEEMAVRMEAEEKAQQALRDELAGSIAERNLVQEKLTVQLQELEDLRAAVDIARRESETRDKAVATAERERDEALQTQQQVQQEIDQLRAEAEVTRGLVDMAAPSDEALREELEQAKKNVDVAIRLRSQAEEQVTALQHEVEHLKTAAAMPEGHIPSLDENDPQGAALLNHDYDAGNRQAYGDSAVLIEDDDTAMASTPAAADPGRASSGGGWKGLIGGLLMGAGLAGGGVWWVLTQGIGSVQPLLSTDSTTPAAKPETASSVVVPEPRREVSAPQKTAAAKAPTAAETQASKAPKRQPGVDTAKAGVVAKTPNPVSVPSFSKGSSRVAVNELETAAVTPAESTAVEKAAPVAEAPKPKPKPQKSQPVGTFRESLAGGGRAPLMAKFQADSFLMGSGLSSPHFDERPQHRVDLGRFALSKREVTFADYDRFARDTGRRLPSDAGWGRGERPVINVSWKDAVAYTEWLSEQTGSRYRLPTEAEWEFVARAGKQTRFAWGNEVGQGNANCFDCDSQWSGRETAPAGSFQANAFGVHDMAGNVMEWVEDCYHKDYSQAPADGAAYAPGGCDQRVARGGAYTSPADNVRSASRDSRDAGVRLDNLGFRVVREY